MTQKIDNINFRILTTIISTKNMKFSVFFVFNINELVFEIFKYLDMKSIILFSQTCKYYRQYNVHQCPKKQRIQLLCSC